MGRRTGFCAYTQGNRKSDPGLTSDTNSFRQFTGAVVVIPVDMIRRLAIATDFIEHDSSAVNTRYNTSQ